MSYPGGGYPNNPYNLSRYPPPGYPPARSFLDDPANEKLFAGVAHLSLFFLPIVLPLVLWLVLKDKLSYASYQAKQALWFHVLIPVIILLVFTVGVGITFLLTTLGFAGTAASASQGSPLPIAAVGALGILGFVLVFLICIVMLALSLGSTLLAIIGAVKAFNGQPFHYPPLGRL